MHITNRGLPCQYDHNLVISLLSKMQIKQLSELTEKLLLSDDVDRSDVVNEYNIGVDEFSKRNGFGFLKELGIASSGVYIARFRYVTMYQGMGEEVGKVKYNCKNPELN